MSRKTHRPRVRLDARPFATIQTGKRVLVAASDNNIFPQFHDGQIITIYTNSGKAHRCLVIDHRRYATLAGLMVEEQMHILLNQPPANLPHDHQYVVLCVEPLPSVAELARLKSSA